MSFLAGQASAVVKLYNNHDPNESSHNDLSVCKQKAKHIEKFDDNIKSLLVEGERKFNKLKGYKSFVSFMKLSSVFCSFWSQTKNTGVV